MDRARRAGFTALIVVVMVAAAGGVVGPNARAASVTWPPSTLVVSEVQTGGTSASDEFVEVANQGTEPVDLAGLEIVYATATGSTVTRKATWSVGTILEPGKRFLVANTAGIYGAVADTTYSGGFAATGGAIGLRLVGGSAVDAVGWGDATSPFVEGSAASAPPAGSSIERAPGGLAGNTMDTNDNLADWFVQGAPSPQGRVAPPVPEPGTSPTPTASNSPSPVPTPTPNGTATATGSPAATPAATPTATPVPTAEPTPVPTPTATATPIPTATATPIPTATATPASTATPIPTATATPTPTPRPIAEARGLADGTVVTIQGVLTTPLGAVESGHGGFVQDATGGIALYLDALAVGSWPAGTTITVQGTLSSRFSQRTLRITESSLAAVGPESLPEVVDLETGAADETAEGVRVRVSGTIAGAPDQLTDGLGVTVDDGSGPLRAVIGTAALDGWTLSSGMVATITGPLGQRDSSGTGVAGYRIHATIAGELEVAVAPTASPTATSTPAPTPAPTSAPSPTATGTVVPSPTATPTSSATARPTPSPTPSATATPVPTPTPETMTLDAVRLLSVGGTVHTTGIVIAEDGRLGTPSLLAIGDSSAGLVVHLPTGAGSYPRGTRLDVAGKLAAPYGQLEIRPSKADIQAIGTGPLPAAIPLPSTGLAEADEGRLVTATGRLSAKPKKSTTGDLSFVLDRDGSLAIKVMADTTSGIAVGALTVGASYRVTGVVGQRATHSGALDGYRVWLRDRADIVATAGPSPSPRSSGDRSATTAPATVATVTISRALKVMDRAIAIDATVTTPATLLDASGRRIVVQDASGAVELLLPTDSSAPPIGARVHAEGRIGIAYGAPRLRVDRIRVSGTGAPPSPLVLHRMPGVAHEWRLVRVAGRVVSIHKLGDRWRAEVAVGKDRVVIMGQAGAGIASGTMVEGSTATVTGIARRPAPTASDTRYAVTPRFPADVRVSGQPSGGASGGTSTTTGSPGRGSAAGDPAGAGTGGDGVPAVIDADLDDLAALVGRRVRVGGLVVDLRSDGFTLDDGTTTGRIALRGAALELLPMIEPDDALNAVGTVELTADAFTVVVDDPGGIVLAGDPNGADVAGASGPPGVGPAASGDGMVAPGDSVHTNRLAGFGVAPWPVDAGAAGVGSLLAVSVLSVAVTLVRRSRSRRRLATRIAGRLASFAAPSETLRDPNVAEREPSTNHAA